MVKVAVVLPAFNEANDLPPTLAQVSQSLASLQNIEPKIIVVDDGSTDSTADVVRQFSGSCEISLASHKVNRGLGQALVTGFQHAVTDADIVITMDADCSHDPALFAQMIRKIEEGSDVVIGSRFVRGGEMIGVTLPRRMLSEGARLVMSTLFPYRNVSDYSSGFRAYRSAILKALMEYHGTSFISERGFACQVEVLLKLRDLDAALTEIPLVLRYDRKTGDSKMRICRTISRYGCVIARNLLPERLPRATVHVGR
ncbi:MAG: glycosyltransferase [Bdellovibrionales bacterium]|nr:glycosyltransferase [Bdellovibrionales bacterium]